MSYRVERIAGVIREVVSDAIANRLSDPRVCHFTSVTRVEVTPDLEFADVYVSVMGNAAESRRTMEGLASGRGLIHSLLAKAVDLRKCPRLRFHLDEGLKKGGEIIRELDRLAAEREARTGIRERPSDAEPDAGDDA